MFRIGAHVSVSDGFGEAVAKQAELGGSCGQIFVGSPRGWSVSEVSDEDVTEFHQAMDAHDIGPWIVHGTYLINFATPKEDLGEKSVTCVQEELNACQKLGIPYYVFHPGSHTGAGPDQGISNVAERLSALDIPESTTVLLENTSGKGTSLGKDLTELSGMVAQSAYSYDSLGICLDTCHLYAAGYDITSREGLDELVNVCETEFGLEQIEYLHLNDSKHPFDSEKDEHEHIGEGEIGDVGFENFINSEAFRDKPMVLETPEDSKGYEWNIEKCKDLRLTN